MATLKEFEEALRQHGMTNALAILDGLKKRDREKRTIAPARRVVGRKMTAELARSILDLHASTGMTQQEIAFKLGVNQGRVNEVIKRGKWLSTDPHAPEAVSRDKAMRRLDQRAKERRSGPVVVPVPATVAVPAGAQRSSAPAVSARSPTELSLDRPDAVRLKQGRAVAKVLPTMEAVAVQAPRQVLRRPPAAPSSIVSAQLAFLDL